MQKKCIVCGSPDLKVDHVHEAKNPHSGEVEKMALIVCRLGHKFPDSDPAYKAGLTSEEYLEREAANG